MVFLLNPWKLANREVKTSLQTNDLSEKHCGAMGRQHAVWTVNGAAFMMIHGTMTNLTSMQMNALMHCAINLADTGGSPLSQHAQLWGTRLRHYSSSTSSAVCTQKPIKSYILFKNNVPSDHSLQAMAKNFHVLSSYRQRARTCTLPVANVHILLVATGHCRYINVLCMHMSYSQLEATVDRTWCD